MEMNTKEALTRIKTGHFGSEYGFDWQLLVDSVGIIGEMFRNGQIHEIVQCKDCRHYKNGFCYNPNTFDDEKTCGNTAPDWFCADGDRR